MNLFFKSALGLVLIIGNAIFGATHYASAADVPPELQGVGITERLGEKVDIHGLRFRDEAGQNVLLSKYFESGKPVVLALAYYGCPSLCTFIFNGMVEAFRGFEWQLGKDYHAVVVSIDPEEDAELASEKKAAYLQELGEEGAGSGWHFLTGDEDQIKALASQIGFGYRYDEKAQEYAHSAGLFVLTPQGVLSRVLFGIQFAKRNLKLSLLEASDGKIGTIVDRLIMFCYRYDPAARGYTVYAFNLMKAGGGMTLVFLSFYFTWFWRTERRLRQLRKEEEGNASA